MSDKFPEPYSEKPLTTEAVVVRDKSTKQKEYPSTFKPGKEKLQPEEIRITALGTGYPARRAQGCAGFMVELGNGDVFIFDAGAGTNMAFNSLKIPYWRASKFFITHYHLDHIADLPVYYDFGQSNSRLEPMHIYGPAGEKEELGINALVDSIYKFAAWHDRSKKGNLDVRGFVMEAHEFEPDEAKVVYEENDVTVTAFPVPHGIYGAVGYRLDYAGMSVVYAGDCEPSTLTVENSQNVDVLIHEIFNPPETYVEKMGWTEQMAKIVAWTKHTSPEAASKVFSQANPKMAVGFHAMVAPGTPQPVLDGVRSGYDGPFTLAQDFTVINVTKEQIVTRMADVNLWEYVVSDPEYIKKMGGSNQDASVMHGLTPELEATVIPVKEIEEFKKELEEKGMR